MFSVVKQASMDLIASNTYMTTVIFTNSVFNITNGNLIQSDQPVNLQFINCTFIINNPGSQYIALKYKPLYGCLNNLFPNYGDLNLQNCNFQDNSYSLSILSSSTDYQKWLFNVTSSYNVILMNVTFNKMSSRLVAQFTDNNYNCTQNFNTQQLIALNSLNFSQTDLVLRFYYNNIKAVSNQLLFKLENSNFSQIYPIGRDFILISLNQNTSYGFSGSTPQCLKFNGNIFDGISSDQSLIDLMLKGSNVTANSNIVRNSLLQEIFKTTSSDFISVSQLQLLNVSNQSSAIQANRYLLNFQSTNYDINIDSLNITKSNLTTSSAVYINLVRTVSLTNTLIQNSYMNKSDLVVLNFPYSFSFYQTNITNLLLLSSQSERYVFSVSKLELSQGFSTFSLKEITMINSQPQLLKINSAIVLSATDTTKYNIDAKFCDFENNVYSGLDLFGFYSLTTNRFDLNDYFCFSPSQIPACSSGYYFDTILKACTSCPAGCATCSKENLCTSCLLPSMFVNSTGFCQCPQYQYFMNINAPVCLQCLSKCATCSNEYSCMTYANCPNPFQYVNSQGGCTFNCTTGLIQGGLTSCQSCQDSNCELCVFNQTSQSQNCGRCKAGMFLDLTTYTCLPQCSNTSMSITSYNIYGFTGRAVSYCRPYTNGTILTFSYYVDSTALSNIFTLGTYEYPFANLDSPFREVFNYMYDNRTQFTVYLQRNTTYKIHHAIMPIYILNIQQATINSYGNFSLPRPIIYITTMPYIVPDSKLYQMSDTTFNTTYRQTRGDISSTEINTVITRIGTFRTNLTVSNVIFQSIMLGDQLNNYLLTPTDTIFSKFSMDNCMIDVDGRIYNSQTPQSITFTNNQLNLTNMYNAIYVDIQYVCVTNATQFAYNKYIFIGNYFFAQYQQALLSFFYFVTQDDVIMEQNTFDNCSFISQSTRPFFNYAPSAFCDVKGRTQKISLSHNTFKNLKNSNIAAVWNFLSLTNATRVYNIVNNTLMNSELNTQFITVQMQQPSNLTVAQNTFQNVTTQSGCLFMVVQGATSNVSIMNETYKGGSSFDNTYYIQTANYLNISNVTLQNFNNPSRTSSGTAFFRILNINGNLTMQGITVQNSIFNYGSLIQLDQAPVLTLNQMSIVNNTVQNNDFMILNYVQVLQVQNIQIYQMLKNSDKQRFILSIPNLSLGKKSSFLFNNISFVNSQNSLLDIQNLNILNSTSTQAFNIPISQITLTNNTLLKKDNLISFDKLQYNYMTINLTNFSISQNYIANGQVFFVGSNVNVIGLKNANVSNNFGQFLYLSPTLLTSATLLSFEIDKLNFYQNNAMNDGLIWIQTNSQIKITNTQFIENYSYGRGSVMFADFTNAYALFINCQFLRNYAYEGGVFYTSYQSEIEVQNSVIQQNFAILGGVAYVNNDGILNINSATQINNNQALNACLLFTINSGYLSFFDSLLISQNDQNTPLIDKSIFLSLNNDYKFFKQDFFLQMQTIKDKINKTITEKTDSAFLSISSAFQITNSLITENDNLISASTLSTISIQNTLISNVFTQNRIIQSVYSQTLLSNVTLSNITQDQSSSTAPTATQNFLISIESQSVLNSTNLFLINIQGLVQYITESIAYFDGIQYENITNKGTAASMFSYDNSQVNKSNGIIKNISQPYISPIFSLDTINSSFSNLTITKFYRLIFSQSMSESYFDNITVSNYSRVSVKNAPLITESSLVIYSVNSNTSAKNLNCSNLATNFTSPIINSYTYSDSEFRSFVTITYSYFSNNRARTSGGAVISRNNDVQVLNTTFLNNTALTSSAGALLLQCDTDYVRTCDYSISNCTFQNNSALLNGGAIQYTYYPPTIDSSNVFINNSAEYGQDVAAFPVQIEIIQSVVTSRMRRALDSNQSSVVVLNDSMVQQMGLTNAVVYEVIDEQVSGNALTQILSFQLVDKDSVDINTDSTSTASLIPQDTNNVRLLGSKTVTASNGIYIFDSVIVVALPGTQVLLKVQSDQIDQSKIRDAYNIQIQDIYLLLNMRLCQIGEQQTVDNKCVVCSDGFYQLLNNQTTCNGCPENAQCQNGYQIIPDAGYWRASVNSTDVYECPNTASCISSYEPQCEPGYGDNLCQSCVQYNGTWYSQEDPYTCTQCLDYNLNTFRLAGVSILLVAYYIILVVINIRAAGQQKVTTVYMRILTNYFQVLTLAQSYDLSWQDALMNFLEAISFIAKASEMIISQDCFIRDSVDNWHPLYVKMVIATLLPLAVIVLIYIFWKIFGLFRNSNNYTNQIIVSIVILIFVCINPITTLVFQIFNCKDIFNDGSKYLVIDYSVECWTGDHAIYAKATGIPIMIVWVIAMPAAALIAMYQRRHHLKEDVNVQKLGFLYVGLADEAFYWEIAIYFRKLAMISVNIFFISFKPLYRALVGFIILIIYIEVLQKVKPYQSEEINSLEFKANIAAFLTFYGGLFFINTDFPVVTIYLFVISIIIANLIFWLSWIRLMFTKPYDKVANFLLKYICPCLLKWRKNQKRINKYSQMQQNDESSMMMAGADSNREPDEFQQSFTKVQTAMNISARGAEGEEKNGIKKGITSIIRKKTFTSSQGAQAANQNEFQGFEYMEAKPKEKKKSKSKKKPALQHNSNDLNSTAFDQPTTRARGDATRAGNETNLANDSVHDDAFRAQTSRKGKTKKDKTAKQDFVDYAQKGSSHQSQTIQEEEEKDQKSKRDKKKKRRLEKDLIEADEEPSQNNNFVFQPQSTVDKSLFGEISTPARGGDSNYQMQQKSFRSNKKSQLDSFKEINSHIDNQSSLKSHKEQAVKIISTKNHDIAKQISHKHISAPATRVRNNDENIQYHKQELESLESYGHYIVEQLKNQNLVQNEKGSEGSKISNQGSSSSGKSQNEVFKAGSDDYQSQREMIVSQPQLRPDSNQQNRSPLNQKIPPSPLIVNQQRAVEYNDSNSQITPLSPAVKASSSSKQSSRKKTHSKDKRQKDKLGNNYQINIPKEVNQVSNSDKNVAPSRDLQNQDKSHFNSTFNPNNEDDKIQSQNQLSPNKIQSKHSGMKLSDNPIQNQNSVKIPSQTLNKDNDNKQAFMSQKSSINGDKANPTLKLSKTKLEGALRGVTAVIKTPRSSKSSESENDDQKNQSSSFGHTEQNI